MLHKCTSKFGIICSYELIMCLLIKLLHLLHCVHCILKRCVSNLKKKKELDVCDRVCMVREEAEDAGSGRDSGVRSG